MMQPKMRSRVARRLLINYRVDPTVAARALPEPFRPRLVDGSAIGGICLIRLEDLRPPWAPPALSLTTENAAHRFAVEFDEHGHGVFVPRRDSNSRLAHLLGGRLFPGAHHRANIETHESGGRYEISLTSFDGTTSAAVVADTTDALQDASIFGTVENASSFFRHDPLGFSTTTTHPPHFDCVELETQQWSLTPLAVESVTSSMFDDRTAFPLGSAEFDSAFLMRDIDAVWRPHQRLRAA
ncbi:MAG TPA: DUF2071 domain-containing protein [Acidimicrobiia bacterium]